MREFLKSWTFPILTLFTFGAVIGAIIVDIRVVAAVFFIGFLLTVSISSLVGSAPITLVLEPLEEDARKGIKRRRIQSGVLAVLSLCFLTVMFYNDLFVTGLIIIAAGSAFFFGLNVGGQYHFDQIDKGSVRRTTFPGDDE